MLNNSKNSDSNIGKYYNISINSSTNIKNDASFKVISNKDDINIFKNMNSVTSKSDKFQKTITDENNLIEKFSGLNLNILESNYVKNREKNLNIEYDNFCKNFTKK